MCVDAADALRVVCFVLVMLRIVLLALLVGFLIMSCAIIAVILYRSVMIVCLGRNCLPVMLVI